MEADVEDGQVFTFSVHYSNIVDGQAENNKSQGIGQTILIDREKGKIEPVANGSAPKRSKSCLNGPATRLPDYDTLNNNDARLVISNGAPKSDISKLLTEGDQLYETDKTHDGVLQNVGYTNQILPRKSLYYYRSNISSLTAHELALNYLNQKKSCAVPSPNRRPRNLSGLGRRPAVIGDGGLPLYETRMPAVQLPVVARKSALSRTYCISIAVVIGILFLALVFVPVAWVTTQNDPAALEKDILPGNDTHTTTLHSNGLTSQSTETIAPSRIITSLSDITTRTSSVFITTRSWTSTVVALSSTTLSPPSASISTTTQSTSSPTTAATTRATQPITTSASTTRATAPTSSTQPPTTTILSTSTTQTTTTSTTTTASTTTSPTTTQTSTTTTAQPITSTSPSSQLQTVGSLPGSNRDVNIPVTTADSAATDDVHKTSLSPSVPLKMGSISGDIQSGGNGSSIPQESNDAQVTSGGDSDATLAEVYGTTAAAESFQVQSSSVSSINSDNFAT